MDSAPSVTFRGNAYVVVAGDRFKLDRSTLTLLGDADKSGFSDPKPAVFALVGIDAGEVAVAFDGGQPVLLVERGFFNALPTDGPKGSDPLAHAMPALCQYWKDPKPIDCR